MMKKILILSMITGMGLLAHSQDIPQRPRDNSVTASRPRPMEGLGLTPQQKADLKALREEGRSRATAIQDDNTLTDAEKKAQLKSLQAAQREKMKALLTPEQWEKWQAQRRQAPQRPPQGIDAPRHEPRPAEEEMNGYTPRHTAADWKKELHLTDGQERKLAALHAENEAHITAIKADERLTPERKEMEIRRFMAGQKAKRNAILSPIQQQQWDSHYRQYKADEGRNDREGAEKFQKDNTYYYN